MNHLPLGAGPEFDRIRAIQRELGGTGWELGDDCAILPPGRRQVVVSTDLSVEGVHFRRDWLTLEEIGWRAAAGALSDLAAEGASAVGVLASVGAPAGTDAGALAELMHGVG
ncbi:MAG TPA: AIR synthase related protein, partial [Gemmatimonadales bacterium]|nr:AIR synthase related protein [Gemmatimonadales bacterium]